MRKQPRRALACFAGALRLDPDLDSARDGMLEALKARSFLYRAMLAYYTWSARLSCTMQWLFIGGTYAVSLYANRYISSGGAQHRWMWPVLIAFYAFVYLSWTAYPVFNLLQAMSRHNRLVLSSDERLRGRLVRQLISLGAWCHRVVGLRRWARGNVCVSGGRDAVDVHGCRRFTGG